ncbi:RadC family protein [Dolosicoccus paucivorans]|uniref:RadC family protein n=1 Tax=Dolosicoccus paucivorans TaxID=84521 RepID=UPI000C80814A|nr:DNA repair protein RadC [Dolosicoccus paucivorans]PMB83936.1 hypothetical protein CJ206_06410 [Dolosicoccus paucivorans]
MQNSLLKVQELPVDSQPRERLLLYGAKALADYELLAILLRTGTRKASVLNLAQSVLTHFKDLYQLRQVSIEELQEVPGIGPVKAIELQAAIEFGQRVYQSRLLKRGQILSTTAAGEWLLDNMKHLHQEHLMALFLNTKNEVIQTKNIFIGSVSQSVAHPREIFKEAVKYPTARIIIAHNHPSGDTKPSPADLNFTKRLIECGDLMGIELLDHFIIGEDRYLSIREETNLFS